MNTNIKDEAIITTTTTTTTNNNNTKNIKSHTYNTYGLEKIAVTIKAKNDGFIAPPDFDSVQKRNDSLTSVMNKNEINSFVFSDI
eukprot:Pgem_evm1s13495